MAATAAAGAASATPAPPERSLWHRVRSWWTGSAAGPATDTLPAVVPLDVAIAREEAFIRASLRIQAHPQVLLPSEYPQGSIEPPIPSCWRTFVAWTDCYGLGSQAKSYYRFGRRPDCGRRHEAWKQCLFLRRTTSDDHERARAYIHECARDAVVDRREHGSSEDIGATLGRFVERFVGEGHARMLVAGAVTGHQ